MRLADRIVVVELNNESTLIGNSVDQIKGLLILKNPAWWYKGDKVSLLTCKPEEVAINSYSIMFSYVTDDSKLVGRYNEVWEDERKSDE